MADKLPVVINAGQYEQLQSTDTLAPISHAPSPPSNDYTFLTSTEKWLEPLSYPLRAYNSLGGVALAEPVWGGLLSASGAGTTMATQTLRLLAVYLPQAATITGVKYSTVLAGAYTASNYNGVGLYSYSGGNLTLRASSTTDGNIWKATGLTITAKAFSSTYPATAGIYFIAALYCSSAQTTAPTLLSGAASVSTICESFDFTNSAKMNGTVASLTALPSPTQAMSGVTVSSAHIWMALY